MSLHYLGKHEPGNFFELEIFYSVVFVETQCIGLKYKRLTVHQCLTDTSQNKILQMQSWPALSVDKFGITKHGLSYFRLQLPSLSTALQKSPRIPGHKMLCIGISTGRKISTKYQGHQSTKCRHHTQNYVQYYTRIIEAS